MVDLIDRLVQLAVGDVDFLHAAGAGVQQAEAVGLLRGISDSGEGHLVGGDLVAARFQVETRLRLLQGVVRLFQCGLASGVLEQDVCDVVLHVVVLLLKNASAARFYSTVRRFAISFSVGVCYDLFCFIHKPLFALSIARIYEFVNSFACELPAISRRYFCVQCPTKKTTL